MPRLYLFLLFFVTAQLLQAQTFNITGKITDNTGVSLPGASVALQQLWGDPVKGTATDAEGAFIIKEVGKGGYVLKISMLGFTEAKKQVTLSGQSVDIGTLMLEQDSKVLKEVQIKDQMSTAVQKVDTMQFNSGAFKVMKDASAEELLEKMPTVTLEKGQITAQGEKVQQVLVDGKPFFGNDPTAALKSLPAEVIDKVQIFDAQSDQAQFSGVNDGNTVKTINIVTKAGMKNGQFGKMYAGYGYEDKYQVGANLNYFDGDRRISLIGMTNNINVQNFSTEDILGATGNSGGGGRGGMGGGRQGGGGQGGGGRPNGGSTGDFLVNPSGGIATTHAIGLNYTDKWGKKIDVTGSYFFNKSISDATKAISRQFVVNDNSASEIYGENSTSQSDNLNHRATLRLEYRLDSFNTFILRPRLTLQQNAGNSLTIGETNLGQTLLNSTNNRYNSDLNGLNFSNSLLWRHRFSKKGRTVSIDLSGGSAPKQGESILRSVNYFAKGSMPKIDSIDQRSTLDLNSLNGAANIEYSEPLTENSQLSLTYRYSVQQESNDRYTNDWLESTGGYDLINEPLSNVFSNDYVTNQSGIGYNYAKGRDINYNFRVNTQWANLRNYQVYPKTTNVKQDFFNILPSGMVRYSLDKDHNIRLFYRSSTELPSVEQLQNVVNNTNPLQLTAGNPALGQAEQHNVFFRYQGTNPVKSTSSFFMVGGGLTRDYIANSTFFASRDNPIFQDLDVQPGAQLTLPVNLDGYRNARSYFTYGFPLKKIKCNLNVDLSYNYSRVPGLVNELENKANNHSVGAGLTLSSNISTKVDFTISVRPTWNRSTNTLPTAFNAEYLNQNARIKFNWQIMEGFVLRTDLTHTLYSGFSDGFNQNFWLWNLGIGKKVCKNQRGEITLAVNDMLNQNRNIQRTVTESYVEDVQTNALTRFVMLSFTYNLRNFNTGKKPSERKEGDIQGRGW